MVEVIKVASTEALNKSGKTPGSFVCGQGGIAAWPKPIKGTSLAQLTI